jgi:hypothetical protein
MRATLLALSVALLGSVQLANAEVVQVITYPATTVTETTIPAATVTETVKTTTTETTTLPGGTVTATKTVVSSSPAVLPAGPSYIVVHPTRGIITGRFDIATRMINGAPLEVGEYIVDQSTGKVYATVDATGSLVTVTALPATAVLPDHFLVVEGKLVYFADNIAYRRAKLDLQIGVAHASGKLSHNQVRNLRKELDEIAVLSRKTNRKGELSASTLRRIENKFANIQADMAGDLAETSKRRARIGIVAD